MLGRSALVAAVSTAIGIAACVSDDPVNLNAAKDAGAEAQASSSSTGSSSGTSSSGASSSGTLGPNEGGLLCGLITETTHPSCPGTGPADPTCRDDLKTACCPGIACVQSTSGGLCPSPSTTPPYPCFAGAQCNDGAAGDYPTHCCAEGTLADDAKRNGCDTPMRLTLAPGKSTTCQPQCGAGSVQICRLGDDKEKCPTPTTCLATVIAIPNPNGGEPFLRRVGVCRQ